MPIYEYQCTACGHTLEIMQKMAEAPLKHCPACQKDSLKKLISAAGFQLKGTGWYATDFRNKGKPEAKDKPATGDSGTDSKTEGAASGDKSTTTATTGKEGET
ncbi:MAG TPA: zinc ribbon domain-containing protein [Gammaproteobacteria bacterium]|nr:zinc ribbon domain-containing protein [Gammaproteobacteria bacterium]